MAEYRKIEYRIGKDGKITERVINGSGSSCTETTKEIEKALGNVEAQELLPEYYGEQENLTTSETEYLNQW
ncbi:MAG: DUF2997 domain-containing protein [Gomphosphaeria aponina SAG 52.96 = DSM 107014]|uniref:DUF2997 domain-containing protein n=1 Tax=Gomphosphaeria aponina SAG 52.96 = DSM 107014 TaxID=1521640 RepID=A0A941GWA1_9CHRO|nr:DUF2997 domain-containing protein [Gomphosphaeria aponina SAG 52.96 = DSM 107014]